MPRAWVVDAARRPRPPLLAFTLERVRPGVDARPVGAARLALAVVDIGVASLTSPPEVAAAGRHHPANADTLAVPPAVDNPTGAGVDRSARRVAAAAAAS